MIKPEIKEALEIFIKEGGTVIADEGFGLRTVNTWIQPYDVDFKPVLHARMRHRRLNSGATVSYNGKVGTVRPGEALGKTNHNTPHAHVSGQGPKTTVGLNKNPVNKSHKSLSAQQKRMVSRNWNEIEELIRRVWP